MTHTKTLTQTQFHTRVSVCVCETVLNCLAQIVLNCPTRYRIGA